MCFVRFLLRVVFCAPFWMCCVGLFVMLVPRALFCMCSVDCLLRSVFVHCFLCVLLTFCHVSVSRTVWYELSWQYVTVVSRAVFCMCFVFFCFVSVFWTVYIVFCWIVCHFSALHGVLYVFCLIACDVSALRNLLYEFSLMFFICSVIFFKLVLGHCFEGVLLDYLSR